jgi:hypothetical protein
MTQYVKNIMLDGMYCILSAQNMFSVVSKSTISKLVVPNDAKIIDVEIIEIMIKSINHARNLSVHLAMIIFDESFDSLMRINSIQINKMY